MRTATAAGDEGLTAACDTMQKAVGYTPFRAAIKQVNAHLSQHPNPTSLGDPERKVLSKRFGLNEDELAEVASPTFTLLDAHYLDQCFLFRDAARSLDVESLPPLERAAAAFDWVMRQVRLRQGATDLLPAAFVLRRGWGSDRDRAVVFLTLLEQLGLHGCMLAYAEEIEGKTRARLWIPGVLVDKEIYLFDTRLGLPLPGPKGAGIATWNQLRTQADLFQPLAGDDKHAYDVTWAQVKNAEIYLVCPLSALAPRMKFLEARLSGQRPIRLAIDPGPLLGELESASGGPVQVWNQPGQGDSPLRALRRFLNVDEGGADSSGRLQRSVRELMPFEIPAQVAAMQERLSSRIIMMFANPLWNRPDPSQPTFTTGLSFFLDTRQPRELLLRGRFEEASNQLVAVLDQLRPLKDAPRPEASLDRPLYQWHEAAMAAEADLLRAGTSFQRDEARAKVEQVWKDGLPILGQLIQGTALQPLAAETTYLLALCKHDEAERRDSRVRRQGTAAPLAELQVAQEAWKGTAELWDNFVGSYPAAPTAAAARLCHAMALVKLAQIQQLQTAKETDPAKRKECEDARQNNRKAAAALLNDLSGSLTNLEQTGRLYLARQLKDSLPLMR